MKLLIVRGGAIAGAGLARVDEQLLELGETGNDLLGDASGEIAFAGLPLRFSNGNTMIEGPRPGASATAVSGSVAALQTQ